jgi:hypothetical protein
MGIPHGQLIPVNAGRYKGNASSKEGDSAYKPYPSRGRKADWPTIVFEAGISESLSRLRIDTGWWLTNSGGDVNIVIIIAVNQRQLRIQVEKWELALPDLGRPCTRSNQQMPARTHEITIYPDAITGAPLVVGAPMVLEFDKIFLRPATPPEIDVVFTAEDLSGWAARVWDAL